MNKGAQMKSLWYIFLFLPLALHAGFFTTTEMELYQQMLQKQNFDLQSTTFLKDWSASTHYKIPCITQAINVPFSFPELSADFHQIMAQNQPDSTLFFATQKLFPQMHEPVASPPEIPGILTPKSVASYIQILCDAASKPYIRAWQNLDDNRRQELRYYLLTLYRESSDSLKYRAYFQEHQLLQFPEQSTSEIMKLVDAIDFSAAMEAGFIFQAGCKQLYRALLQSPIRLVKPRTISTTWGNCYFGSIGPDRCDISAIFRYDPAGNDSYVSPMGSDFQNPFFCHLDADGDDLYRSKEIGSLFGVQSGCGFVRDAAGNDVYRGSDISCASLFGFLDFSDEAGDDLYDFGGFAAGAAAYGVALMHDAAGNDTYRITQFGQGFGGTLGCGILHDNQGNDLYYAGGRYDHAPLAPYDFRSMAQGFGFGGRPDFAGGIGILYDEAGNDRYNGGVYAQGVGYWYALGMLMDDEGNDFYTAVYYPQGSGIHLAGGLLYDGAGEDHYYSKHGPGQGAGHDYGTGFLIDRGGNDSYNVEGGNGLGLTNSVGVFLDVWGDDHYLGSQSSSYGFANGARDSGGLGLFLDTGGADQYLQSFCANDSLWMRGSYGIGLDTLLVQTTQPIQAEAEIFAADIDSLADISEIFAIASRWGVGNEKQRVDNAAAILLKRDEEAAAYIFAEKLGSKSGLVYRAISNFARDSKVFNPYLLQALAHDDSLVVKNAIALLGSTRDTLHIPELAKFLDAHRFETTVLGALGAMRCDQVLPILQKYIHADDEKTRVIVARGLKRIDSPRSKELLASMAKDPSFLVQAMVRMTLK